MSEDYYRAYIVYAVIGDTLFAVDPLVLGQGKIIMGKDQSGGYDHVWHYDKLSEAVLAFAMWDKKTDSEPEGWTRHLPSGRHRPDGDKSLEFIR